MNVRKEARLERASEILHYIRCAPVGGDIELPISINVTDMQSVHFHTDLVKLLCDRKISHITFCDFDLIDVVSLTDYHYTQLLKVINASHLQNVTFNLSGLCGDDILYFYTTLRYHVHPVPLGVHTPRFHCVTDLPYSLCNWEESFARLTRKVTNPYVLFAMVGQLQAAGGKKAKPISHHRPIRTAGANPRMLLPNRGC